MEEILHALECGDNDVPQKFPDPFRYAPCPAVIMAAGKVISHIDSDRSLHDAMSEGKMLGVLVVRTDGGYGFLAAFSGNAGGRNSLPYFVPPIFDLLDPDGHFRKEESIISGISRRIDSIVSSQEYKSAEAGISLLSEKKTEAENRWKCRMAESRQRRERLRKAIASGEKPSEDDMHFYEGHDLNAGMIKESQFEKAELKRISARHEAMIREAIDRAAPMRDEVRSLTERRKVMSDNLQKWISDNFRVRNARGETESITGIFSRRGLVPPGGTGECAAPKLLQYAYLNGLEPVAMGEFWYGASSGKELRTHGRFYPSCTSKCGPLLEFMLEGIETVSAGTVSDVPEIIYEDASIIVADKPSGLPSVPGLNGMKSLQEMLEDSGRKIYSVHRLDMDTSGLIVFAMTPSVQAALQKAFASRNIHKTYAASVDIGSGEKAAEWRMKHHAGEEGLISLPLAPDIVHRPRQCVDTAGKAAYSTYRILSVGEDTASVEFHPLTGRTHQLRVHAAHPDGLDAPVTGDLLYGGAGSASRLHLHASGLEFTHPVTGKHMIFSSKPPWEKVTP